MKNSRFISILLFFVLIYFYIYNYQEYKIDIFDTEIYKVKTKIEYQCNLPVLIPWSEDAKKLIKPTKRYDNCKKHSPLSYIDKKGLFINQTVNATYYAGAITECVFSKVSKDANNSKSFNLGNL